MAAELDAEQQAARVRRQLAGDYPDAQCELDHRNAFELLVATILSAQCTDERVNQVTRALFKKHPGAADLAALKQDELEELVRPTGFYRNKAKSLKACCQALCDEHDGQVPREMEAMVELPGVGRKTANVVLGTAYGLPTGIVVDTHVSRVAQRLGLTEETKADKIEQDLMSLVPQDEWIEFSLRMILHGRRVCRARKPDCEHCSLKDDCPRIGVAP